MARPLCGNDSAAYAREPQGNGIAERFVRTVEELRLAHLAFKAAYNRQCRICRQGYKSPAQVREKQRSTGPHEFQGETVRETLDRYNRYTRPT